MTRKSTKNTKKMNQSERISVRCTKKVKDDFTRRMKKGGYDTQGEFIVDALKAFDDIEKIERNNAQVYCIAQDILNYVSIKIDQNNGVCLNEHFDEYLEGRIDELCKLVK